MVYIIQFVCMYTALCSVHYLWVACIHCGSIVDYTGGFFVFSRTLSGGVLLMYAAELKLYVSALVHLTFPDSLLTHLHHTLHYR